MDLGINGRNALITGGANGIGEGISKFLAEAGVNITVTSRTNKSIEILKEKLSHYNIKVDGYVVDFLDEDSVKKLFVEMQTDNYTCDILVNNAGHNLEITDPYCDINDWNKVIGLNFLTPVEICNMAIPQMKKNNWGRIVNITSIWGSVTKEYRASYSSSKFALDGMTVALAAEVASMGILANSVAPGFIDTDLTRKVWGDKGIQEIKNIIPIKRLGQPNEVASFVSFLVSEENTYISGQNIMIDGGFSRV